MAEKSPLRKSFSKVARRAGLAALFVAAVGGGGFMREHDFATPVPAAIETPLIVPLLPPPDSIVAPPFDIKLLPYEQQVFQYNTLPPLLPTDKERLDHMTPDQRQEFYMQKFCFTAGSTPADEARKTEMFTAFDSLSKLTFLGKPLVDLAGSTGLRLCGLEHLPSGIAAQYLPGKTAVISGPITTKEERVLKLGHEIQHAAQDKNGLLSYDYSWDIQSRVTRNLSIEAAALTMEFMVAYEAKLAGDTAYWDLLQKNFGGTTFTDKATYALIEAEYAKSITAGQTKDTALRAAGLAVWEHVFESDDWRNFYLNCELTNYFRDLDEGRFNRGDSISHAQFGQDKIDKAGKVGELPSFTRGAHFPDANGLIARNEKMKWAYEAAEIDRMKKMGGVDSATASYLRTQALLGGNPYLDLDLGKVYRQSTDNSWVKGRKFSYLYEVMDEMIKPPAPLPVPVPDLPAPPKVAQGPRAPVM